MLALVPTIGYICMGVIVVIVVLCREVFFRKKK